MIGLGGQISILYIRVRAHNRNTAHLLRRTDQLERADLISTKSLHLAWLGNVLYG